MAPESEFDIQLRNRPRRKGRKIMKEFSQQELRVMLEARRGTSIITFTSVTDAKLKKRGCPYQNVKKHSRVNAMVGYDYENSVNLQRGREGAETDFQAKPRQWGERISPLFVEHKGNLYLTVKVQRAVEKPRYFGSDGVEIDLGDLAPWLPSRRPTGQGLESEVIHREYSLANIKSITLGGEKIQIV